MTLKHLELRQWELDSLLIIVSKEHVKIRVKINQKWTWQCWTENYINIKKSQQKRWRGFLKDKYLALDIFSRILSHITFSLPCLAFFFFTTIYAQLVLITYIFTPSVLWLTDCETKDLSTCLTLCHIWKDSYIWSAKTDRQQDSQKWHSQEPLTVLGYMSSYVKRGRFPVRKICKSTTLQN